MLLDSNTSWSSLDDIPVKVLKSVLLLLLLFHLVDCVNIKSTDLSDTYVKTLSEGSNSESVSLQVKTTGGVIFNTSAKPVTADLVASNGIVHIIDKVMLPPTIVNLGLNNPIFSSLVTALTDSRHTTNFVEILNGKEPFTIFAPTNDAFQVLLDSNEAWSTLADLPIETIDTVLKYHVVNKANVQADQLTASDITMM